MGETFSPVDRTFPESMELWEVLKALTERSHFNFSPRRVSSVAIKFEAQIEYDTKIFGGGIKHFIGFEGLTKSWYETFLNVYKQNYRH